MKWIFVTSAIILALILGVVSQEKPESPFGAQPPCVEKKDKSIHEKINTCGLSAKERANLKGREIAKLPPQTRQNVKFSGADYDIEIVSIEAIEGGVQVFARAWNSDGTQIGFGRDGTVDIERFVFINPPVLVRDPTGNIDLSYTDDVTGEFVSRKFKEDTKQAVLQSLAHTISVKSEKFGSENIVPNKVGNTTSTFYPDADTESTSVDGRTFRGAVNESWSTIRAGAGLGADDNSTPSDLFGNITSDSGGVNWRTIQRGIITFDTSSIPDGDSVSSATFSGYVESVLTGVSGQSVVVAAGSPATATAVASGDFQLPGNWGSTEFASRIAISSLTTSAYNDFSLNSSGLSHISLTGVTGFGFRLSGDYDDSEPTHPGSQQTARANVSAAENTGTSQDPKLVVEHAAAANEYNEDEGGDIIWW